jgi:hypothetical protein
MILAVMEPLWLNASSHHDRGGPTELDYCDIDCQVLTASLFEGNSRVSKLARASSWKGYRYVHPRKVIQNGAAIVRKLPVLRLRHAIGNSTHSTV